MTKVPTNQELLDSKLLYCLNNYDEDNTTEWEREFLEDLGELPDDATFTPLQAAKLTEIYDKL